MKQRSLESWAKSTKHQSLNATTCLHQPHRGYATVEILSERYEQAMENILSFIDGRPVDLLNPEIRPLNKP